MKKKLNSVLKFALNAMQTRLAAKFNFIYIHLWKFNANLWLSSSRLFDVKAVICQNGHWNVVFKQNITTHLHFKKSSLQLAKNQAQINYNNAQLKKKQNSLQILCSKTGFKIYIPRFVCICVYGSHRLASHCN